MAQDTGKFRTNTKDQYYTKQAIATQCVKTILEKVPEVASYQWIEPSAGNGVFLNCLPSNIDKLGIDIDPKSSGILKGDFLEWQPTTDKLRLFFGNPPFGSQSSLAKKFIQHAAEYGTVIAFILPRSFVKPSMSRAFPLLFHCLYTEELPKHSFEVNGKRYDVPCIFQIWQKKTTEREIPQAVKEVGFMYVKPSETFDIVCKRVGGEAGKCMAKDTRVFDKKHDKDYNYFIQLEEQFRPYTQDILETMNMHIFPSNTTGFRSLSKSEINEVLNEILVSSYFSS
jgi:hypothetical protein